MSRLTYTNEMLDFLRVGYKQSRVPELTVSFNDKFGTTKTEQQIKSTLKNHKILAGRKGVLSKGEGIKLFTPVQVKFIRKEYTNLSRQDLLTAVNDQFGLDIKINQLVAFLKNQKIRSGRSGRYEKGNVPWTTGKAGTGLVSANSGSFKRGQQPANHKPIGHERFTKDGYIMVKVAEQNSWNSSMSGWYRLKQIVEWEKVHGPVPKGQILRFKDGCRTNCEPANLFLVSRGENIRLTQMNYGEQPEELKPLILSVAKLDQAIYERV